MSQRCVFIIGHAVVRRVEKGSETILHRETYRKRKNIRKTSKTYRRRKESEGKVIPIY